VKEGGNDSNDGLTYASAKATLNSVISSYSIVGGDTIYLDGNITHYYTPIFTSSSQGSKIHPTSGNTETVTSLAGSVVTFMSAASGVSPNADYVCIYNSFSGNAGAFKVIAANGRQITVDTSVLPGGVFLQEASSPWGLIGAIIRPVVITSYNSGSTARIQNSNDGIKFNGSSYHYIDNIDIYNNSRYNVFVDGGSNFVVFNKVMMHHSDYNAITVRHENVLANSDYMIVQYCDLSQSGMNGVDNNGALIYAGHATDETYHQNYQVYMYNKFHQDSGGNAGIPDKLGTIYNGKINASYVVFWGNYIYGWCDGFKTTYGAIKLGKGPHLIANNYIASSYAPNVGYGGVVFMAAFATTNTHYIFNNIIATSGGKYNNAAIYLEGGNYANARVYNNTIYNVSNAVKIDGWGNEGHLGYFYNNIIHTASKGLWHHMPEGQKCGVIDNHDYNIVYNVSNPFYTTSPCNPVGKQTHEYTNDPNLVDPANEKFGITGSSFAKGKGTNLSAYFVVDKHDAVDLRAISKVAPLIRPDSSWDMGAYQYILKPVKGLKVLP
jgi:hypothetical protein